MAITINGNGTIGGVSVGGLPDGTVTPSDLSTGHPNWDSSGNVGIGTSSPDALLDIEGPSATHYINATSGNANTYYELAGTLTGSIEVGGGDSVYLSARNAAGDMIFRTGGTNERMRIDSSGRLLVGKTSAGANNIGWEYEGSGGAMLVTRTNNPTCILNRQGGAGDTIVFRFQNSDCGNINVNTNSTAFVTSSDYRLKENVVEVTDGIDRVKLLKPSRFNFIADPNRTLDGFLAHEVSSIVPEAITGTKDAMRTEDVYDEDGNVTGTQEVPDYQGIDQSKLVPLLTAALQEAITKIESLETEMITVKSRLDALESA